MPAPYGMVIWAPSIHNKLKEFRKGHYASSLAAHTPRMQRPCLAQVSKPWKRDANISAVNLLTSAQLQRNTLGGSLSTIVPIAWACVTPVLTGSLSQELWGMGTVLSPILPNFWINFPVFLHFLFGGGGGKKNWCFLGKCYCFFVFPCVQYIFLYFFFRLFEINFIF